jgi:hypothetical protein
MRVIETQGIVTAEGELLVRVRLPGNPAPGPHPVVLVIEDRVVEQRPQPLKLPLLPVESWPSNLSLRREDMYDDWGR